MKTETLFEKAKKIAETTHEQTKSERIQLEDLHENVNILVNSLLQKYDK